MSENNITPLIKHISHDLYAAVDLGSNSFHLVISRYEHGRFTVIDKQREVVRLAAGLDEQGLLSEEVALRALSCLEKFAQLLMHLAKKNVRVVGTNALRRLHNKNQFLVRAERAIGQNIDIIAGREEARLIYLGVSKWSGKTNIKRLVIDIGGGSTEIIVGQGSKAIKRESLELGCVVQTQRFFFDGVMSASRFEKATQSAELVIRPLATYFIQQGWEQVIGCSGTMKALCTALGDSNKEQITYEMLLKLHHIALSAEHIDQLKQVDINRDRKAVFAGGLSILIALFRAFHLETISVSDIALREGVLYDLVGRNSDENVCDITINSMMQRWNVESDFAKNVRDTALYIYDFVAQSWEVDEELLKNALSWSALLHELGLRIAHDGYQEHGAYVVANADMEGFTNRVQLLLSALILSHRGKFPEASFNECVPLSLLGPAKKLSLILRLAVLLHRGRHFDKKKLVKVNIKKKGLVLEFKANFLTENSLTAADLSIEKSRLKAVNLRLEYS